MLDMRFGAQTGTLPPSLPLIPLSVLRISGNLLQGSPEEALAYIFGGCQPVVLPNPCSCAGHTEPSVLLQLSRYLWPTMCELLCSGSAPAHLHALMLGAPPQNFTGSIQSTAATGHASYFDTTIRSTARIVDVRCAPRGYLCRPWGELPLTLR